MRPAATAILWDVLVERLREVVNAANVLPCKLRRNSFRPQPLMGAGRRHVLAEVDQPKPLRLQLLLARPQLRTVGGGGGAQEKGQRQQHVGAYCATVRTCRKARAAN